LIAEAEKGFPRFRWPRRASSAEMSRSERRRRDQRDAERLQLASVADLLDHQITGDAAGGVHDDMAGTVSRDVGQRDPELRAGLDRVGAGDGRAVELADDPVPWARANAASAYLWRLSLSFSAPTLPAPEVLR